MAKFNLYLLEMAYNVGLKFSTPEEYFLKQSIDKNWSWDSNIWNPSTYDHNGKFLSPLFSLSRLHHR